MSMLTRCPTCSTSFRITTDQLVSRQGKVRCGKCQNVFSALGSLVHTREPVAHPPSGPTEPLDAPPALGPLTAAGPVTGGDLLEAPTAATAEQAAFDAAIQKEADARKAATAAREGTPSGTGENSETGEDEDGSPRRGRRIAWLSLAGVLAAGTLLSAQAAYFYRDQLAVLQPEAKPWLLEMCAELKCKVETPVDPQAINIESSGLEADPQEKTQLQLSALLRNRAALAQNLPYLELTLLDAQEAPLARRVFRPDEYAPAAGALAANGEYQVRLAIDASQLKANGYRLYAFYP